MTRTDPLDLRDKTMSELMEIDRENDDKLQTVLSSEDPWSPNKDGEVAGFLADRRQIRAEMERRRDELLKEVKKIDYLGSASSGRGGLSSASSQWWKF